MEIKMASSTGNAALPAAGAGPAAVAAAGERMGK